MGRCVYSPTKKEEKKIAKICGILEEERKRAVKDKSGQAAVIRDNRLANLRFLKRMVCAEGPMNFINRACRVKLSREAGNEISDILKE